MIVQISLLPVESAERCAKAILRSVCRGDRGNRFVGTVASDGLTIWKLQTRRIADLANNKLH
ncbi:hypothetical protein HID58_005379 [Brassica napus]|uniref:Uncharacterized protein n=1 Tax=Brassica napus TaxID=3708 RepID=A0ABQ8E8E1_BRANA|nr:hypothetical protein HID58_005379 [Brassica napus]